MSTRLLAVISEGQEAAALSSMAALVAVARAEQATVRLAYFRRIPAARMDAYDRVAVPAELEMERVEAAAVQALGAAARAFDDVVMEPRVRFGRAAREVLVEREAFAANLVVFMTSRDPGPLARLRAWALRRRVSELGNVRVLVLQAPSRPGRSWQLETVPRWPEAMAGQRR
jgi:hypothetical protein